MSTAKVARIVLFCVVGGALAAAQTPLPPDEAYLSVRSVNKQIPININDQPWGRADLYRVEKLSAALRAP